jgi:hypothetical protein
MLTGPTSLIPAPESHLNVQCWTLLFVMGVCRATGGMWVSYCWVATQIKILKYLT